MNQETTPRNSAVLGTADQRGKKETEKNKIYLRPMLYKKKSNKLSISIKCQDRKKKKQEL